MGSRQKWRCESRIIFLDTEVIMRPVRRRVDAEIWGCEQLFQATKAQGQGISELQRLNRVKRTRLRLMVTVK